MKATPGSVRSEVLARYKSHIQSGQAEINQRFLEGLPPFETLHARSDLIDRFLRDLWQEMRLPDTLALIAVGGYGKGFLSPHSDIDLLLLIPTPLNPALSEQLEQLIGLLWDIGLEIGHSVRTVEDCLTEAAKDLTVQTALVEARLLAGNKTLFTEMVTRFRNQLNPQTFFHAKRMEQTERYLRYHDTPYSLEPNCKESPGGLRDLQSILWIAQVAGYGNSWQDLHRHGFITEAEALGLARRETFLQRVRIHLHLHTRRREDRILFDFQTAIAEKLGFSATETRLASEQLTQE